jgi:hypothetical protein
VLWTSTDLTPNHANEFWHKSFGVKEHTAKALANPEALAKFNPGQNSAVDISHKISHKISHNTVKNNSQK